MSCPQSESVVNHQSSAPPIKNRQFFVKVFYLSAFCKVVFGEIKSNRRILRFFRAFHRLVLFRALVRRFFAAERTYPFPEAFRLSDVAHKVFRAYFRLAAAFSRFAPPFTLRLLPVDTFLRAPQAPSDHSRASCALKARNSPHSPPLRPARDDSLLLSHARRTDAFHAGTLVSALPHPSRARMANRTHKSSSPAPLLRISTFPVCLVAHTE